MTARQMIAALESPPPAIDHEWAMFSVVILSTMVLAMIVVGYWIRKVTE